ncbi:hypothetical protein DVA80_21150, partial [Acinetobacter baumannii]|uniref:hypothetical protein n=1 Tax=Acinetobacter baumannii TaxID=470 RepID=UPI000E08A663
VLLWCWFCGFFGWCGFGVVCCCWVGGGGGLLGGCFGWGGGCCFGVVGFFWGGFLLGFFVFVCWVFLFAWGLI